MKPATELRYSELAAYPLFKSLRLQYNFFLISIIAITAFLSKGLIVLQQVSPQTALNLQSLCVLLTLGLIPLSLWLFGKRRPALLKIEDWDGRQKAYKQLSLIRLGLLWFLIAANIISYFFTLSYSFLLCAGMGVIASIFCIPSLKKIKQDLFEEEIGEMEDDDIEEA